MFETSFRAELAALNFGSVLTEELWTEIKNHYESPGRYYHNLAHLDHIMSELMPVGSQVTHWPTLVLSVAYHDIIYNPYRGNNEVKSALLAEERLRLSPLPERQVENVAYYILATATHKYNLGGDSLLLIDADLSIFGASEEVYHQYAQNIRKEYRLYPGFMYKRGRRKALQSFLERKTIYHTAHFQEKYEEQARNNLERELQTLS